MKKYIVPKGTIICYYDSALAIWDEMKTERTAIYTENEMYIAENQEEAILKYGSNVVDVCDFTKGDYPFKLPATGNKTRHFIYFFVPDKSRPLIEVPVYAIKESNK